MNHRKITGNESVADVDSLLETKLKETDKKKKEGHGRVEGEARSERHEAKIPREVNLS